ncbi:MAG TPA: hypothetical protein VGR95_00020 [Thermoanaerobaculia bacterium]|nr:hypothetical protein [Thermoanaerobaculia bacterium]
MAEELLRSQGAEAATGMKFRWAENHDGFFASAITEVERRGEQWVVTRLDRSKERLPEEELGLRRLA